MVRKKNNFLFCLDRLSLEDSITMADVSLAHVDVEWTVVDVNVGVQYALNKR
jgi:hypothetical protein